MSRARTGIAVVVAVLAAGCRDTRPWVSVQVTGPESPAITGLSAYVMLDTGVRSQSHNYDFLPDGGTLKLPTGFVLELDPSSSGHITVLVTAEPIGAAVPLHGSADTTISGWGRYALTVALSEGGGDAGSDGPVDGGPGDDSGGDGNFAADPARLELLAGQVGGNATADGIGSVPLLSSPAAIAADGNGHIYIADSTEHVIRRFDIATERLTTVAGQAGVPGSTDASGGAARFSSPSGLAVDGTLLYVADTGNGHIRVLDTGNGNVQTVRDNSSVAVPFTAPVGLTLESGGQLLVTDTLDQTVSRLVVGGGVRTVLAGQSGTAGRSDGTGAAAQLNAPSGVCMLDSTHAVVADRDNHTLRLLDVSTAAMSTLAGSAGTTGSVEGAAPRFNHPSSVACTGGSVYVADRDNQTVRVVDASGHSRLLAGAADQYGWRDGAAARFSLPGAVGADGAGHVFVGDLGNHTLRRVRTDDGTTATVAGSGVPGTRDGARGGARIRQPLGVAWDGANTLFVSTSNSNMIHRVDLRTGTTSQLAGAPNVFGSADGVGATAHFNNPGAMAYSAGVLYLADRDNNTIRSVVVGTGQVSTLAGAPLMAGATDGAATTARFNQPRGVALVGNVLYIADQGGGTIRTLDLGTSMVSTLAGSGGMSGEMDGTGAAARFNGPSDIIAIGGELFVADYGGGTVRKVVISSGDVTTLATGLTGPAGITSSANGLWVSEHDGQQLVLLNATSGAVQSTVGLATGGYQDGAPARFGSLQGVAAAGGRLYVADESNSCIRVVDEATGRASTLTGTPGLTAKQDDFGGRARFAQPVGLQLVDGALFVSDYLDSRVRRIALDSGAVTTYAGSGVVGHADGTGTAAVLAHPYGLALSGHNLLLSDYGSCITQAIDTTTSIVATFAGNGSCSELDGVGGSARFEGPSGIADDGGSRLWVADIDGHTIRYQDTTYGVVSTLAGSGDQAGSTDGTGSAARFNSPRGLVFDNAHTLYVADSGNQVIRTVDVNSGEVITIAGGVNNMGSSDGPALQARFNTPVAVALSPDHSKLYIADRDNSTVRVLTLATGLVSTLAGTPGQTGVSPGPLPGRLNGPTYLHTLPTGELLVSDEGVVLLIR